MTPTRNPHLKGDTLVLSQSWSIEELVASAARRAGPVTPLRWDHVNVNAVIARPWRILFVDLAPPRLAEALAIAQLARGRQDVGAIIGLAPFMLQGAELLTANTAVARLTEVVFADSNDARGAVRAHILDESGRGALAIALRTARRAVPDGLDRLTRAVLLSRGSRVTLEALAKRVGVRRRSIQRDIESCLGMTAGDFLDWCRVVHGVSLLEHASWRVEDVAPVIGFEDVETFRRATRRLLERLPHELHEPGSTEAAGRELGERARKAELVAARTRLHHYHTPHTPS